MHKSYLRTFLFAHKFGKIRSEVVSRSVDLQKNWLRIDTPLHDTGAQSSISPFLSNTNHSDNKTVHAVQYLCIIEFNKIPWTFQIELGAWTGFY